MKSALLPALVCSAKCPRCNLPVRFTVFESGLGGEFATFAGQSTGALYRLDLGQVHYQGKTLAELVKGAEHAEGGRDFLREIPNAVFCPFCKSDFAAEHSVIDEEVTVSAFQL